MDVPTLSPSPAALPAATAIRIALVEDDANFANAFQAALAGVPDMRLVGSYGTVAQALGMLERAPVDVLVVDLGLPDGSGIAVIEAAHERWPACAIMVSTTFADEQHVLHSIEVGASGYLLKDSALDKIADEIRVLHGGGSPISPRIARQVLMRFRRGEAAPAAASRQPSAALSDREQQTLELITKGFNYDEIAKLMYVSRNTVRSFVRRIYAKLEVNSKTEAIYEAHQQGLLVR